MLFSFWQFRFVVTWNQLISWCALHLSAIENSFELRSSFIDFELDPIMFESCLHFESSHGVRYEPVIASAPVSQRVSPSRSPRIPTDSISNKTLHNPTKWNEKKNPNLKSINRSRIMLQTQTIGKSNDRSSEQWRQKMREIKKTGLHSAVRQMTIKSCDIISRIKTLLSSSNYKRKRPNDVLHCR